MLADAGVDMLHVDRVERWLFSYWRSPMLARPEQALAYDTGKGVSRYLPSKARRYGQTGTDDIVGTADLILASRSELLVIDWKTGAARHVDTAATNAQIRALAAMAYDALCAEDGIPPDGFRVVAILAFVSDDGTVTSDEVELSPSDCEAILSDLSALAEYAKTAAPVPGPHCSDLFCPLLGAGCPVGALAIERARAVIAGGPLPVLPDIATNEEAARVARALPHLESFVEALAHQLRQWVDINGPIDLGGSFFRRVDTERETLVAEVAAPILERWGLGSALSVSTSKAAIRRAAVSAKSAEDILSEIAAAGGIKSNRSSIYKETGANPGGRRDGSAR
jgi:hypothetical protein